MLVMHPWTLCTLSKNSIAEQHTLAQSLSLSLIFLCVYVYSYAQIRLCMCIGTYVHKWRLELNPGC